MTRRFNVRAATRGRTLIHDPAKLLPGFETPGEAKKAKQHLIKVLNRQPNLYCHYTANEIEKCGERRAGLRGYCDSASCPVCLREFRRWFTNSFATLAGHFKTKRGNYGVVVTVIVSGLIAPVGGLELLDVLAIKRRLSRGFANLRPERSIIGGIDVSFNEEAGSSKPGHFQVHAAFAVLGHGASKKARRRIHRTVTACFRLEPSAHVRVKVRRLRDLVRQGSYLLKATFSKRLSFIGSDGRRNTKKFPLKPKQLAEIAMWLWKYQPLDRVLLHAVLRDRNRLVLQETRP